MRAVVADDLAGARAIAKVHGGFDDCAIDDILVDEIAADRRLHLLLAP
jgi:hypothetical protein